MDTKSVAMRFIPTLLVALVLAASTLSADVSYPMRISSGMYEEELEAPDYYESVYPLVLTFAYPLWNNVDLTLRDWHRTCVNDSYKPSYSCVLFYHYERVIERYQYEIVQHNIKSFGGSLPLGTIKPKLDKCDEIQKHFSTMITAQKSVESYLEDLKQCPHGFLTVTRNITDYIYPIKPTYSKMLSRFEAEFSSKIPQERTTDRTAPAAYVNNLLASQSLMMIHYEFENNRWENAFKSCMLQAIPTSLIQAANLTLALTNIQNEIRRTGWELTVPVNEISRYLMYPLTDCTFTEEREFVVRIQIPIRRRNFVPKLVKLQAIPFLLNRELFSDDESKSDYSICTTQELEGTYAVDNGTKYLTEVECEPDVHLCPLPDPAKIYSPHICPPAYFFGKAMTFRKHCMLYCDRLADETVVNLPIVRRMASNVFTVTGTSDYNVKIVCGPNQTHQQYVYLPDLGALQIHLPCDCSINYQDQLFKPEAPCGLSRNTTIIHLIPNQFFKPEFVKANQGSLSISGYGKENMSGLFIHPDPDEENYEHHVPARALIDDGETGRSHDLMLWIAVCIQGFVIVLVVGYLVKQHVSNPNKYPVGVKRMRFQNMKDLGGSTEQIVENDCVN